VYTCNPSTVEAEAGGWRVLGHPGQHREFKGSMGYIGRPFLIKKKKNQKNMHAPIHTSIF
jgi:hypothetical protein